MGFMSKLKFWKKDDDFNYDDFLKDTTPDPLASPAPDPLANRPDPLAHTDSFGPAPDPLAQPTYNPSTAASYTPPPPVQNQFSNPLENKDHELLLSKLDTIHALLKNIDQRLSVLERAHGQTDSRREHLW